MPAPLRTAREGLSETYQTVPPGRPREPHLLLLLAAQGGRQFPRLFRAAVLRPPRRRAPYRQRPPGRRALRGAAAPGALQPRRQQRLCRPDGRHWRPLLVRGAHAEPAGAGGGRAQNAARLELARRHHLQFPLLPDLIPVFAVPGVHWRCTRLRHRAGRARPWRRRGGGRLRPCRAAAPYPAAARARAAVIATRATHRARSQLARPCSCARACVCCLPFARAPLPGRCARPGYPPLAPPHLAMRRALPDWVLRRCGQHWRARRAPPTAPAQSATAPCYECGFLPTSTLNASATLSTSTRPLALIEHLCKPPMLSLQPFLASAASLSMRSWQVGLAP